MSMGTESVAYGSRRRQVAIIGFDVPAAAHPQAQARPGRVPPGAGDGQGRTHRGAGLQVVARELFPSQNPFGKIVRIRIEWRMRVIGVLGRRGEQDRRRHRRHGRDSRRHGNAACSIARSLFRILVQVRAARRPRPRQDPDRRAAGRSATARRTSPVIDARTRSSRRCPAILERADAGAGRHCRHLAVGWPASAS